MFCSPIIYSQQGLNQGWLHRRECNAFTVNLSSIKTTWLSRQEATFCTADGNLSLRNRVVINRRNDVTERETIAVLKRWIFCEKFGNNNRNFRVNGNFKKIEDNWGILELTTLSSCRILELEKLWKSWTLELRSRIPRSRVIAKLNI